MPVKTDPTSTTPRGLCGTFYGCAAHNHTPSDTAAPRQRHSVALSTDCERCPLAAATFEVSINSAGSVGLRAPRSLFRRSASLPLAPHRSPRSRARISVTPRAEDHATCLALHVAHGCTQALLHARTRLHMWCTWCLDPSRQQTHACKKVVPTPPPHQSHYHNAARTSITVDWRAGVQVHMLPRSPEVCPNAALLRAKVWCSCRLAANVVVRPAGSRSTWSQRQFARVRGVNATLLACCARLRWVSLQPAPMMCHERRGRNAHMRRPLKLVFQIPADEVDSSQSGARASGGYPRELSTTPGSTPQKVHAAATQVRASPASSCKS